MTEFIIAMIVFIASHTIPAYRPWRDALIRRMGAVGYQLFYGTISLAAIAWLIIAYSAAPHDMLWYPWEWMRWAVVLIMPFSCILLTAGATSRNPFSIGAGSDGFNPERPGIVSITRHPLMWALALWSGMHFMANGDAPDLILFGMFLALSLFGPVSLDHKRRVKTDDEALRKLFASTSNIPFAAVLSGRIRPDWRGIGRRRIIGGLLLYAAILFGHEYVIGISAIP
ncbi:MAG: hypothetical protein A3G18_01460 [Rhodospirillales bacterium RIFCSPLOWO2_12_FULL_58_28]|nr:MAG: hypothetical protein A3H92_04660 [Rhodospirillales bacterium RIFCSPLOWO2_02_FULL_58_16]OHC78066.1 MAG: hypothetical protein A3G18_01460 [Rhodospirillales bacterium RIFCSPLOWO2_12_FULL_58_28]